MILVYDADSGLRALIVDVVKKALGREECALCEITHSLSGKRGAWRRCEARLGVVVEELHRDQLPAARGMSRDELPCILAREGSEAPRILLSRDHIISCRGNVEALEGMLLASLSPATSGR